MEKVDRTVVRNQPYQRSGIWIRERHNERKNQSYSNPDIEPERSPLNCHFRQCEYTYEKALDDLLERGIVSTRGLKADAKVFEEMVFDVNSGYFDKHSAGSSGGGYEYARRFFEEVYHFAEKEVGSEYTLSAVMHTDERNRGLSEKLGRDVFHYHLHVVYIPVVDKKVKWSKRCKDERLIGTTKEVIHQISHSKKWAFVPKLDESWMPVLDRNGNPKRIPSYSLLQDRFFEHMKAAGYGDLERGIRGSTVEHLSVLDYKIQQDRNELAELNREVAEQETQLSLTEQQLSLMQKAEVTVQELSAIGKIKRFGNKVEMTVTEFETLKKLSVEGLHSRAAIERLHTEYTELLRRYYAIKKKYEWLFDFTRDFRMAMKFSPEMVIDVISDIIHEAKRAWKRVKMQDKHLR